MKLTEEELHAATKALVAWFRSQDIDPQDAGLIMIDLTAHLLVEKTRDIAALQNSINLWKVGLSVSVACELRKPK